MKKDYSKEVATLKADVAAMWRLQCQNLYNTKNLGVLAVRECLQNSIDAVKAAINKGEITQGIIHIDTDNNDLLVDDNGVGMSLETLHDKFLTLGGTTKDGKDDVGGFGLAKSVILGCGTGFSVHTRSYTFTNEDLGKNPIATTKHRQGTRIEMNNVQSGKDKQIGSDAKGFKLAVLHYVATSQIPSNITVCYHNQEVTPWFVPSKKSHRSPAQFGITTDLIPDHTKININAYKPHSGSYLYVRLNGLTQFKQYLSWNAECAIVLDINTTLSPRATEYPFSTNREGLKSQYQPLVERICSKVSQSPIAISANDDFKEVIYDNANASVEVARRIASTVISKDITAASIAINKAIAGINRQMATQGVADVGKLVHQIAADTKVGKSTVVAKLDKNHMQRLTNPLSHSWVVWTDTHQKYPQMKQDKQVGVILIWDAILNLMASHISNLDGKVFYPGIIVKEDTLGMCLEKYADGEQRTYIMLNPHNIPQTRDITTLALYLMGVASHELAHMVCGSYEAHGETFSYTREAIMNKNLSSLNQIISILKAGNIHKLTRNTTSTSTEYKDMSLNELITVAKDKGVDVKSLQDKYTDIKILRMRLVMALKKA